MATLIACDSKRRFELGDRTSIGRGVDNSVRVDDPMVSIQHAEIVKCGDGTFHLRDLGSRRGTYVGTKRIEDSELHDRDELLIGPARFRFDEGGEADREELVRLRAIVELNKTIGVEHDLDRLLERLLDTCFQLVRGDRAMVIVYAPGSMTPTAMVARTSAGESLHEVLSTSVLSQIMATREPYLRTEVDSDLVLKRSESLSVQGIRSLIAVPLVYQGTEWLGVIQMDSRAASSVFVDRDLELLGAIAGHAALAIKNAMLVRELQSMRNEEWQRLERVVTNLPVGVVVLDDQHRCLLANDWVMKRSACVGMIAPGMVIDRIVGVSCDVLVGGERREQITSESNDSTFVLSATTSADGREAVVVIADITTERAQQAKAAHQDRLAVIGQLAGGIAHDFNNLLCVILNYAVMLEDAVSIPQLKADVGVIRNAATSASDLVRQLLAFSRRETVTPKITDVIATLAKLEPLLKWTVGAKIALELDVPASAQTVLIDPTQLEQIVMNLVVNARDAITGSGRLKIAVRAVDPNVVLEVSDTGAGMTRAVAARIFEPYYTTKAIGKGTGLGLATVHGIVESCGGEISVDSEVGRGTTFRIALPKRDREADVPAARGRGRVLVVDDDEQLRRIIERMLRTAGYDVRSSSSGEDALLELRSNAVDVLLTDMVMPGMSGRDLARVVAQEFSGIQIVFMSGYHSGVPIPSAQFLAKPFDRSELVRRMEELLSRTLRIG